MPRVRLPFRHRRTRQRKAHSDAAPAALTAAAQLRASRTASDSRRFLRDLLSVSAQNGSRRKRSPPRWEDPVHRRGSCLLAAAVRTAWWMCPGRCIEGRSRHRAVATRRECTCRVCSVASSGARTASSAARSAAAVARRGTTRGDAMREIARRDVGVLGTCRSRQQCRIAEHEARAHAGGISS